MSRNIEIKARCGDLGLAEKLVRQLTTSRGQRLSQEDTFFQVPRTRLKLRELGDGTGQLIQYERTDKQDATESRYVLVPIGEPATLKAALANALGIRAVVRKQRTIYLIGQTRIHLDEVEGLGSFVELEVVLNPGQSAADGIAISERLVKELHIDAADLVASAYVDLLEQEGPTSPTGDDS